MSWQQIIAHAVEIIAYAALGYVGVMGLAALIALPIIFYVIRKDL